MLQKIIVLVISLLVSNSSLASNQQGSELQAQQLFEQLRTLESASHLQRIDILQSAENCINQASDFRQYRECEKQEKLARETFRSTHKPQKQALKKAIKAFRQQWLSHQP